MAQAIAGGDAEDVNLGSEAGGTAAANNALLAPLLVALASIGAGYYGTLFIGENVLQLATGEDVVVNDPVANVLSDMEQGAVNIAYDNAPETTKQVFRALENIGSAAEGVIIYADLATGQNVSAVWGDLSPETKIRIQSAGALVSVIAAPTLAKKLSNSTPNIKPKITTDFNIVAKNSAGLVGNRLPWKSWNEYEKVIVNSREYAKIDDRNYTQHAVDRMQPSSLGVPAGSVGAGRNISPNIIEHVISTGSSRISVVDGVERTIFTSGNVSVVTEDIGKTIITILRHGAQ